jgi:hypothetical protein
MCPRQSCLTREQIVGSKIATSWATSFIVVGRKSYYLYLIGDSVVIDRFRVRVPTAANLVWNQI